MGIITVEKWFASGESNVFRRSEIEFNIPYLIKIICQLTRSEKDF